MKEKITYILVLIAILLCVTGIVISKDYIYTNGKYTRIKEQNNDNISTNMILLYSNEKIASTIKKIKNNRLDLDKIENNISETLNITNPTNNFFIKNINGIDYYVLNTIENTINMKHQQTYQRLAKEENRPNKTNCLCYAYAYAQAMLYGKTNQAYAEVKKCDYPGSFNLYLEKNSKNLQIAYDEILNGRPSVIHGTGCGSANQHYFDIVGITVESYEKYVTNGKVNNTFNNATRKVIMKSLLVYDPWGENIENNYYNLGDYIPYYSNSCKWNVDNTIRYQER